MLEVNPNIKPESLQKAKDSKSLSMGATQFATGTTFTISDYTYEPIDNSQNLYPAFVTSIGNIAINTFLRPKPVKPYTDKDGNVVTARRSEGTFIDLLRQLQVENRGKTNDELATIMVEAVKDRQLKVRLCEYITVETQFGPRTKPLLHVDIVEA